VSDEFDSAFDAEFGPDEPKLNGAAPNDRLRLVPPSEMNWNGAQLDLVNGILGCAMMALLYGESGSAKTLIAISLALHVALGRDWCGHPVKQGLVVYLAPEGGHSVHLRFHAWCRYHDVDPSDDLPFRTVPVRIDLCTSDADLAEIIANIRAAEQQLGACVLVVVDTVSRALAGADENTSDAMGCFIVNCDRLREEIGATVLAVHHTPRGGNHAARLHGARVRQRDPHGGP
jgi:RecA-family ATPase